MSFAIFTALFALGVFAQLCTLGILGEACAGKKGLSQESDEVALLQVSRDVALKKGSRPATRTLSQQFLRSSGGPRVSDDRQATCDCNRLQLAISESIISCPEDEGAVQRTLQIFNAAAQPPVSTCAVVRPLNEDQLARVLTTLDLDDRLSTLSISVKNGGHQPSAWALSGRVVLDLANLRGVEVDKVHKTVRVAAGEKWGAVYQAATHQGFLVHGATDHGVGVSGSVLVGGVSFLSKTRGLVANSLVRLRLCLMNGTLLDLHNVSRNAHHRNLFKLFRAGSGVAAIPIGVVTELTFRLFEPQGRYLGYDDSIMKSSISDAMDLVSDMLTLRSKINDERLSVDITFLKDPLHYLVNMKLFFDGPFSEGLNHSSPFLDLFDAAPQTYATYEEWTRQQTNPHRSVSISSWHGAFVSEHASRKIVKALRNLDSVRQGLTITFEDRALELSRGQDHYKRSHSLVVNYFCKRLEPCSLDGWDELLYSRLFRPHQVAEYLGYLNSPDRHAIAQSLSMWKPYAMPTLKCWRASLGAGKLMGGLGLPADTSDWHQGAFEIQQSLSQVETDVQLSRCHESSLLQDPTDWCGDGLHALPYLGQVALVVGGIEGIGKHIAQLLSQKGANVVIATHDISKCKVLSADFMILGYFIECEIVDLTSRCSMRELVKRRPYASTTFHVAAEASGMDNLDSFFLAQQVFQHNPTASFIAVGSSIILQASGSDTHQVLKGYATILTEGSFKEYRETSVQIRALEMLQQETAADIRIVIPSFNLSTVVRASLKDATLAAVQVVNAGLQDSRLDITGLPCFNGCSKERCRSSAMEVKDGIWNRSSVLLSSPAC